MSVLTTPERTVLDALVCAWSAFIDLPDEHPDDRSDFRRLIHDAQARILMRPARRELDR